ncbi:hypothetical protein ACFL0Q_03415 [Thermodesulfobacteriota bacterium]
MELDIQEVHDRKSLKDFIYLPEAIHQHHGTWVPPLYMDEWRYFNPQKNQAFSYCDTTLLLAWRKGKLCGRVMGIINRRYNELKKEKTARFAYLESYEDWEVTRSLLDRIESWACQKGATKIVGPYGFSDQDPEGLLVEGFQHRATIATYHNFEWMPRFVEQKGYAKDVDYVVYKIHLPETIPDLFMKYYERVVRKGFEILEGTRRRDLKPYIRPALRLMNETYLESGIYGFTPLDEAEMNALAKRYLPILDPRFVKAVKKGNELAGFVIGIPDMTAGIQKARGRLLPFGFLRIARAARTTRQLDLLLGAVNAKYRGLGLDLLMTIKIFFSAKAAGIQVVDSHHEMESNLRVRAVMERFGGVVYKRFRVYQKSLAPHQDTEGRLNG